MGNKLLALAIVCVIIGFSGFIVMSVRGELNKKQEFTIEVNNLPEDYGRWSILTTSIESRYFYTVRFSEEGFKDLWKNGATLELLPQKCFDSSGEGQKIITERSQK